MERNNNVIEFPTQEKSISDQLFDIFLESPVAFMKFVRYCHAPHIMKLDKKSFDLLVSKGFVRPDFSIPSDIRSVVIHSTALF